MGAAIDHGHGRAVLTGGALLAGLGCLAWSRISEPWMLYACWAVLGAAMAMTLYEPAFMEVTKRYPARFKDAITRLTLVGGFDGTLCCPAAAALQGALGWRGALVAMGLVLAPGRAPLHAWALGGPALAAPPPGHEAAADAALHEALRHPAFWMLTLAFAGCAFVSAGFWAHVIPAFAAKGFSEPQALAVLLAVAGSLAVFARGSTVAVMLVFALVFGLAYGLVTMVRGGLIPNCFGRAHIGRISGAMSAVGPLARAAAPYLVALVLVGVGGYREALLLLAGRGGAAAMAFALARR